MIGIFDSGSGGLTVLAAIRRVFPSANVVYFGDIANAPYGVRSREELTDLTLHAIRLLRQRGATTLVSACNSVSASMAVSLFDVFDLETTQVIEMVGPTVASFRGHEGRILVLATSATVLSGMYQSAFRMIGKEVDVQALSNLAGLIEAGASPADIEADIQDAYATRGMGQHDTVLLGCTHYPLAMDSFKRVFGPHVSLIDPAEAVAHRVLRFGWPREVGDGALHFIISKDSETFRRYAASLFPKLEYTIEVL